MISGAVEQPVVTSGGGPRYSGVPAHASAVRIALLGLGQVGSAVARRAGGDVHVLGALVRRPDARAGTYTFPLTSDPASLLDAGPDAVVELLGGVDPARALTLDALARGIPVVTANKTLLAWHGVELFDLPDAPRPPAETPAPPRFFPIYDNIGLSHKDRRHVVPAEAVGRLDGWIGWMAVDGFLRGQWDVVRDGTTATIEVSALSPLRSAEKADVEPEALNLLRMHAPDADRHQVAFGPISRWQRRSPRGGPPAAN